MSMKDIIKQINKWNKIVHISLLSFINVNKRSNLNVFMDSKDLTGACALGSFILSTKLNQNKIKNHVILGSYDDYIGDHCWVEAVGKIFDPTFKQIKFNKSINCTDKNDKNYIFKQKTVLKSDKWNDWDGQNPKLFKWYWKDNHLEIAFSKQGKNYFDLR